ncbi:MAG: cell division protein SepF [Fusobacteriaceae bacterium]
MKKILKGVKEFLGAGDDYEDIEIEEFQEKKEMKVEPIKRTETFTEKKQELKGETAFTNNHEEQKSQEEEDLENCQTIFVDPKNFSDCKKIANYIKNDRMVTLNLEYLDSETAQRMMDFLMGAMLIKVASFIEISKKVYTSVPKSVKVHYDGKKNINDRMYMNIRED